MGMSESDIWHYCLQDLVDLIPDENKAEQATKLVTQMVDKMEELEKRVAKIRAKLEAIESASSYTAMAGISHLKLLKDINEIAREAL